MADSQPTQSHIFGNPEERHCPSPSCGKLLVRRENESEHQFKRRKFCKRKCYGEYKQGRTRPEIYKRVTRVCEVCGKEFQAGGRTYKRRDSRFHNRECAAKARFRTGSVCREMSQQEANAFALLVDGEGSIFLFKKRNGAALRVTVSNTKRELLEWCRTTAGFGSIVTAKARSSKHNAGMFWQINSQAAESLVKQIRPFLVIKTKQADVALDFMRRIRIPADKANRQWQREYLACMQELNRRGPSTEAIP